jgi:hypothetical protein
MKQEVRNAIQRLKNRADIWAEDHCVFSEVLNNEMQSNTEAVATIERALTDTTLEIVKRYRDMGTEDEIIMSNETWDLLNKIIAEAEGGK